MIGRLTETAQTAMQFALTFEQLNTGNAEVTAALGVAGAIRKALKH
jgi:hypothetical protein